MVEEVSEKELLLEKGGKIVKKPQFEEQTPVMNFGTKVTPEESRRGTKRRSLKSEEKRKKLGGRTMGEGGGQTRGKRLGKVEDAALIFDETNSMIGVGCKRRGRVGSLARGGVARKAMQWGEPSRLGGRPGLGKGSQTLTIC